MLSILNICIEVVTASSCIVVAVAQAAAATCRPLLREAHALLPSLNKTPLQTAGSLCFAIVWLINVLGQHCSEFACK